MEIYPTINPVSQCSAQCRRSMRCVLRRICIVLMLAATLPGMSRITIR